MAISADLHMMHSAARDLNCTSSAAPICLQNESPVCEKEKRKSQLQTLLMIDVLCFSLLSRRWRCEMQRTTINKKGFGLMVYLQHLLSRRVKRPRHHVVCVFQDNPRHRPPPRRSLKSLPVLVIRHTWKMTGTQHSSR